MIKYIKSLFKKPEPIMVRSPEKYRCSCGHMTDLEWCEKCGIRNTSAWKNSWPSSRYNYSSTSSYTSSRSDDSNSYYMMSSMSNSSYSSSSCDSSSSDSGSCSSSD